MNIAKVFRIKEILTFKVHIIYRVLNWLIDKIRNNYSFLIIVIGSVLNFLLTLFLKKEFPSYFNTYSLFITFIGITFLYGLLGMDQMILRLGNIKDNKIEITKDVYFTTVSFLFIIPFFISIYFVNKYDNFSFFHLYFTAFSINAIVLSYNIYRLRKLFVISQLFSNTYRILFIIITIMLYLFQYKCGAKNYIQLLSYAIILIGFIAIIYSLKNVIILDEKNPDFLNFFFSLSTNLGLITALGFGDRILIANEISEQALGTYYYYSTVFIFPIRMIGQYVGFKELVYFKTRINKKLVFDKVIKLSFILIVLVCAIFLFIFFDNQSILEIDLKKNISLVILLILLGIVKLFYVLYSSILGARGSYKDFYKLSIFTGLIIITSLLLLFITSITINSVVLALIIILTFRILYIHRHYVH